MASSLLTNSAAMTALQTLRNVSQSLATTQNRISTGMRVATASDNAAYWSIARSMRANNAALSAVSDSLGLSAATVDTQYTGLTAVLGSDGVKIHSDITQIQQDMNNTAASATFNGVNWLRTTATTPATVNLISSYSRVASTPTTNSIAVTVANYSLYTTTQSGYLDTATAGVSIDNMDISALTDSAADQTKLDGYIAQVTAGIN